MREILFRGKYYKTDKWVEGGFFEWLKQPYIVANITDTYAKTNYEVIPETVGQFTGLTDKNGKKIFEGDILNCLTSDFDGSDKYVYNYKITDITDFEKMGFLDFCNELEVIGNIHDNPELLKEGAD